MLVEHALDRYLVQLAANGRSKHTIDQARRHMLLFVRWLQAEGLSGDLDDLDHEDVALFLASEWVRKRADGALRKASSANALRSSLRAFFRYVFEAGSAPRNAARLVRRGRIGPRRPRALSESEEARLRTALRQAKTTTELRDRAMFTLMLDTGLRVGSVVALRVEDLCRESGELRIATMKGGREMVVRLDMSGIALLVAGIGERWRGWVFESRSGDHITTRHVQRRLQMWMSRAAIRARLPPHALRHTFGVRQYGRGVDLLQIRAALGHQSLNTTACYVTT